MIAFLSISPKHAPFSVMSSQCHLIHHPSTHHNSQGHLWLRHPAGMKLGCHSRDPVLKTLEKPKEAPKTPHLPATLDFSHHMTFPFRIPKEWLATPGILSLSRGAVFSLTFGLSTRHPSVWNTVCPSSSEHFLLGLYMSFKSSLVI